MMPEKRNVTEWRHVRWPRVAIVLAALLVVVWLISWAATRLAPWNEAQSMYHANPGLANAPVPLPDQRMAPLTGASVYPFSLRIQTPWSQLGTITSNFNVDYIPFPKERVEMTVFEPYADSLATKMWDDVKGAHDRGNGNIVGGPNYALLAAELMATPDQVKWWKTPAENEPDLFLLEQKSMRLGDIRDIYIVSPSGLRGFQEGNPAVPPYRVRVDLFDSDDRHYQLRIESEDNHGPALSQAELNAMIASLQVTNSAVPANLPTR